jgi:hypothetical protein
VLNATPSSADVDAGRILLRTPFSNLLLCKRVPGASWDTTRHVWTYPATPGHARLIRSSIPKLETSDRFAALLARKSPAPLPPPQAMPEPEPAIALPPGLKTKPWRHQVEAFQFAMERLTKGAGAALLALEMGVGKTLVALMVMAALAARRVLISCPLRVVPVWEQQIERHLDLPLIVVALDDSAGSVANKQKLAEEKAGSRRRDFASPFVEHAMRTAEAWYGPPASGWRPETRTAAAGKEVLDADPAK